MRLNTVCDCMVCVCYCVFYPNRWFPHKCVLFFPQMTATIQICAAGGLSAEPLRWRTEQLLFSEVSANRAAATRVCSQWICLQILSCVYPDSSLTFERAEGSSVCLFTQELNSCFVVCIFCDIKWKCVTCFTRIYSSGNHWWNVNSTFTYCK